MAGAFGDESKTVRLSPITTEGAAESLALLGAGKADLAIGRGDLNMPADAQTLAVLRKNYVVLWSSMGGSRKDSKKKATGMIGQIADLAGRKVGIIGRTRANLELLRTILVASGVDPDKVATSQFGTEEIEKLAQDATIDATSLSGRSIAGSLPPRSPRPRDRAVLRSFFRSKHPRPSR
jgi:ABC-type nitrate/sulfonate/bicarbonate transport system substrate-binding protein